MTDFPWEILKAETLRSLSHDLGIKRNMKRDEVIAFLRAVQKNGLGPALADEIAKDFATSNQNGIYGNAASSSTTTSPVTKTKPTVVPPPARRISTRKRPHPEPEPLFLPDENADRNDMTQEEDEDAEGETDHEFPESISTGFNTRRSRGAKRVRLLEPGPEPGRSTRSRKDKDAGPFVPIPSVSAASSSGRGTQRVSSRRKSTMGAGAGESTSASERRSSRLSRKEEKEVGEEEEEDEHTGPRALVAAFARANAQSRTASAPLTRSKPRVVIASRTHSSTGIATRSTSAPRTSKRVTKPTVKGALLSPTKRPPSVLSRPVRSQPNARQSQRQQAKGSKGRKVFFPVSSTDGSRDGMDVDGRSESPKEIFDGVVLKKRRIARNASGGGNDRDSHLSVHLDEFVANELERQQANGNDVGADPVLDRDDASSLDGSNKENDFSFRNDVSESTEGPEDRLPIGEADAEGEPEPEADALVQDEHHSEPRNPDVNDGHSPPLHDVPQPQFETELQSEPQIEPEANLLPGSRAVTEPEPVQQAV